MHAPGTSIRLLTEADLEAADDILKAAFGSSESAQVDLRRYLTLQHDGWPCATVAGIDAGLVGAIDYGRFAYIGMMAVHPALQSRGLGRALMERLLAWLEARGVPLVLLDATDTGRPLYATLGFLEHDQACLYEQQEPRRPAPQVAQSRPLRPQDLPAVVAFDAPIFGAERGAVIRAYLADFPARGFVVHDEAGQLSGYLCAQSRRIGPWDARRAEDAEALLQAALSLSYAGPPRVVAPQRNAAAANLLTRYGFHLVRATQHMRWGGAGLPGQRERLYGQVSFAIG
jgi:predicted N-acetyltransferase YhbS